MSILLLSPESTHNVLPSLTKKLFDQLKKLDHCELYDEVIKPLSKADFFNYVEKINPKAIFSFNAAGAELDLVMPDKRINNLFSLFSGLHIGWMVDHPIYRIFRLSQVNPKRLVLFPSKDSIEFAKDFNLSGVFSALPFAGSDSIEMGKNHCDRKFDVVIAASFMGRPDGDHSKYTDPINKVVGDTIKIIQEKQFLDPYYVLLDCFLDHSLFCERGDFLVQITKDLYDYQRKYNRIKIIESLVNSGLNIRLIGNGWQSYFGKRDNVTYLDNVLHDDIISIYQDAKVVVNINAVNGASERLFDAIDSGAMVYSEFSMILYEMFGSGNGVLFHNINTQESSIDLLKDIIMNNETEFLALSAKKIILENNTWKHRAEYINKIVNAYG